MHKTLIAIALASLTLPGLARADDHYLRGGIGQAEPDSANIDDSSNAWTLGVGWRFTRHFSVEAGYSDLGDYASSAPAVGGPMNLRITSLELGMAAKLPFGDSKFHGQARAGVHRWENKFNNFEASAKETGADPYYGLGLGYDFNEYFSVSINYERYALDNDAVGDADRLMLAFEMR